VGSDHLFVYGTLLPGHLRWGLLEPYATAVEPATVGGELWDTGNGWPAADFDPTSKSLVPGVVVTFERNDLNRLLGSLDSMEGVSNPPRPGTDPYLRIRVSVTGVEAWTYHATSIAKNWQRCDSWDGQLER